jgi:hypothetical protein
VTGVEVVGGPATDLAFNVHFDEVDVEDAWFSSDLVEYVGHGGAGTARIGDQHFVITDDGEWMPVEDGATDTRPKTWLRWSRTSICKMCGEPGLGRKQLREAQAAVESMVLPLARLGVVREDAEAPPEVEELYVEGVEVARQLHAQAHDWAEHERSRDLQSRGTMWAERARSVAQRFQGGENASISKRNPRVRDMGVLARMQILMTELDVRSTDDPGSDDAVGR